MGPKKNSAKFIGTFSIVMITVGSVDSIRNLPSAALLGSHLIFYYIMAALLFFLPSALVAAELASLGGQTGGIYQWVKNAFGPRPAFLAIWFQWTENVIWYPTILSFIAGTVAYVIAPKLAANRLFILVVIIVVFWLVTLVNLQGIKTSARFATFCAVIGLLIPMILIISLGYYWFITGRPLLISLHVSSLLPSMNQAGLWTSLTAVMMSFAGIEIATVHAKDVTNPGKSYPLAMLISVVILLVTLVGGSLAIAISVPFSQLNVLSGIMQSFHVFLTQFHMTLLLPVMALMLVIGGLGGVNNWIIAPTRGLLLAAQDGHLPALCQRQNQKDVPVVLLIVQAVIVSVVSLVFILMPAVNDAYLWLNALAVQQYIVMYILMFASAIKQRYHNKAEHYGFRIPGGLLGVWLVGLLGMIGCVAIFIIGFIPPEGIDQYGNHYELLLVLGLLIMSLPPFVFYAYCHRND